MTDLIKALADGAALLSRLGEMVERAEAHTRALDRLQERMNHITISLERLDERVVTLENDSGRWLETGDDLDSQIETVVERVLDRVLEDTLDSALSGREITVTL